MQVVQCNQCKKTVNTQGSTIAGGVPVIPINWMRRRVRGEYWGTDSEGNKLYSWWDEIVCPECAAKGNTYGDQG